MDVDECAVDEVKASGASKKVDNRVSIYNGVPELRKVMSPSRALQVIYIG